PAPGADRGAPGGAGAAGAGALGEFRALTCEFRVESRRAARRKPSDGGSGVRVALGVDHAGFELKAAIKQELERLGHDVLDLGTNSPEPVDYPDIAAAVGEAVRGGAAERGVLVCGSGVGACIAANKLHGIRACLCHDTYSA